MVDRQLGVTMPRGQFWHRYNHDGYGETPDGGPFPGEGNRGRLWPLLAGERGEYALAVGELSGDAAGLDARPFIRLAWSIDAGRPVERPRVVVPLREALPLTASRF